MAMNPEDLMAMQQQDPSQQDPNAPQDLTQDPNFDPNSAPEWHDPNADPSQMQQIPDEQHPQYQPEPEPMMVLPDLILTYMNHAIEISRALDLDKKTQADIMSALANSVATLVPLLQNDQQAQHQMDMQKMQAELQIKVQEMQMNMQMKQAELEMKKQEHEMKLQHTQQQNEVNLAMTQAQNQITLKQQEENHNSKLVQNDQAHGQKMEQQKQAAQLKPTSKPTNKGAKK
jgi:hypothetical protein